VEGLEQADNTNSA